MRGERKWISQQDLPLDGGFCLMPQDVLARVGTILFLRFRGVVLPADEKDFRRWSFPYPCTTSFWRFLEAHPAIFVVLIPDEARSIEKFRWSEHKPTLGTRIIGSIGPSNYIESACASWIEKYAAGTPYLIVLPEDRGFLCQDSDHVYYIRKVKGIDDMDLFKVAELLERSKSVIEGDGMGPAERLALGATLELFGHGQLADQVLKELFGDLKIDSRLPLYTEEGRRAWMQPLVGDSRDSQFYRIAKALGVRLRVTAEPADAQTPETALAQISGQSRSDHA